MRQNDESPQSILPEIRYLPDPQLRLLLQYVKIQADKARRKGTTRAIVNELMIALLVDVGLRASEVCGLNIQDLPAAHGENAVRVRDPGGRIRRSVDISSETAAQFKKFVKLYRKGAGGDQPLLVNERGGRLTYMSLYSKIKMLGRKAGIGKLHPEILRHTYLIRLYGATQDLRLVQLQAGHAHPASTARYAKTCERLPDDASSTGNPTPGTDATAVLAARPQRRIAEAAASGGSDNAYRTEECEACGSPVAASVATIIDSGQILCPNCLQDLRSKGR